MAKSYFQVEKEIKTSFQSDKNETKPNDVKIIRKSCKRLPSIDLNIFITLNRDDCIKKINENEVNSPESDLKNASNIKVPRYSPQIETTRYRYENASDIDMHKSLANHDLQVMNRENTSNYCINNSTNSNSIQMDKDFFNFDINSPAKKYFELETAKSPNMYSLKVNPNNLKQFEKSFENSFENSFSFLSPIYGNSSKNDEIDVNSRGYQLNKSLNKCSQIPEDLNLNKSCFEKSFIISENKSISSQISQIEDQKSTDSTDEGTFYTVDDCEEFSSSKDRNNISIDSFENEIEQESPKRRLVLDEESSKNDRSSETDKYKKSIDSIKKDSSSEIIISSLNLPDRYQPPSDFITQANSSYSNAKSRLLTGRNEIDSKLNELKANKNIKKQIKRKHVQFRSPLQQESKLSSFIQRDDMENRDSPNRESISMKSLPRFNIPNDLNKYKKTNLQSILKNNVSKISRDSLNESNLQSNEHYCRDEDFHLESIQKKDERSPKLDSNNERISLANLNDQNSVDNLLNENINKKVSKQNDADMHIPSMYEYNPFEKRQKLSDWFTQSSEGLTKSESRHFGAARSFDYTKMREVPKEGLISKAIREDKVFNEKNSFNRRNLKPFEEQDVPTTMHPFKLKTENSNISDRNQQSKNFFPRFPSLRKIFKK